MKKKLCLILAVLLSFSGNIISKPKADTTQYAEWLDSLSSSYKVVQGNVFLLTNSACSTFISIFDSCFGQNPSSPYIIPQLPIENSYVDPYYAVPLNSPGPDGTTNIIYRLSNNDALIAIVAYPPRGAYFGYQSYVFTRASSNYAGITPPVPRKLSPDPSRYEIFGSIGNDINNVIVQNQCGVAPWGGTVVMYISTSNKNLAKVLADKAIEFGINKNSIFIEPIGSNVITGNGAPADDMMTLMRYAVPESTNAGNAWLNNINKNVLIYKVSNNKVKVSRYDQNTYTPHVVNHKETTHHPYLSKALNQLSTLLKNYLTQKQSTPSKLRATTPLTHTDSDGEPTSGLVGSYCIQYGTLCQGDNQDTSTYAALTLKNLGPQETAFIAGVNHNVVHLNNTHYVTVDIYNTSDLTGVGGISQTNPIAAGFNSGVLTGSAQAVLKTLKISISENYHELKKNIESLYITFIARNINNPTIKSISKYGINLQGTSLVPAGNAISVAERSYVVPCTTTGGDLNYMLYPIVIAASQDFID